RNLAWIAAVLVAVVAGLAGLREALEPPTDEEIAADHFADTADDLGRLLAHALRGNATSPQTAGGTIASIGDVVTDRSRWPSPTRVLRSGHDRDGAWAELVVR